MAQKPLIYPIFPKRKFNVNLKNVKAKKNTMILTIIKMPENVMLAHTYNPDSDKVDGYWWSEKFDGIRGKWNGEVMETRTGKIQMDFPDFITKQLKSIKDENGDPLHLDGEVWFGKNTQKLASGLCRRHNNKEHPELWENMKFMVFDIPYENIPFEERIKKLSNALKKVKDIPNIEGVKHRTYKEEEEHVMSILKKIEDAGGEGIMLRKPKSLYEFKRSKSLLKVKSWTYIDAIVTGYLKGTGKHDKRVGALTIRSDQLNEDGKMIYFKVGSGLNDEQRELYIDEEDNEKEGIENAEKWDKKMQVKIDSARKSYANDNESSMDTETVKKLKELGQVINKKHGKERNDALHQINRFFTQIPVVGDTITIRFKEVNESGNPSFPTFVCVRNKLLEG